ncbi:hypothetical protein ACEWY4_020856 [Coilia grayii]|uniref:Helix-turn-helix domain-containing protein n=1 Tax=Coilia grayii TaxID=363190 RepID=A0ABD1J7D5_9TELE
MTYINSTTRFLRFTVEHSTDKVNFLDLTVYKNAQGTLETAIYRKPLSRNTLLRADSHHPKQLIKNIPIGQFLRLRRNCSSDAEFEQGAIEMSKCFHNRGYSAGDISTAYQRAKSAQRSHLHRGFASPRNSLT